MTDWQPYREPLRVTLTRTIAIAVVAGAGLAWWWGGLARWPVASALLLWITVGGHLLELWFLNWLRPRLSDTRRVHIAARISVWFVGGVGLVHGMRLTAITFTGLPRTAFGAWWMAGFGFIVIELVAHLPLQLRGRPSFYNGRG